MTMQGTDTQNQIRRLMAERDLLISAIAPEDYAKIQAQLVAIAESPDEPPQLATLLYRLWQGSQMTPYDAELDGAIASALQPWVEQLQRKG